MKLATDSQNLGRELHRNACGGWAPPGPAGGASRYKGEGKGEKGKKRVWNRDGRNRREGVGRDGKGREVENGEASIWIFVEGRRVASDASATETDAVTATSRLTIRSLRRLLEIYRLSAGGRKR